MKHKIIFKALVGSHSHGTSTPESDEDFSGVYLQDNNDILSYGYEEYVQVNKDEKYFEVKRFLDLLMVANPAAIEILFTPEDCILETSPQFKLIYENRHKFLTKKCYNTFAGYAKTQIQKSKGTDKKMNWENQRVERKGPLDFCYIQFKGKTIPLNIFLENSGYKQENCGLVKLNHMDNTYAMYYDYNQNFKGIVGENSNELRLTSITKEFADNYDPIVLYYNKDGFSTHCKDYKSYQTWLNERNTNRYHTNVSHGQIYDSKNLSHCRRLIDVAIEIGQTGTFTVRRPNVDYLLEIKRGDTPLDKIIIDAEQDIVGLKEIYDNSNLPEDVDKDFVKELLLKIRLYTEPPKKIGVVCESTEQFNVWKNEQNQQSINSRRDFFQIDNNKYYCIIIGQTCSLKSYTFDDMVYLVPQEEIYKNEIFWICLKNSFRNVEYLL